MMRMYADKEREWALYLGMPEESHFRQRYVTRVGELIVEPGNGCAPHEGPPPYANPPVVGGFAVIR